MGTLIKVRSDGKEEIWYSPEYVKRQIGSSFSAGISVGLKVEFHVVQPIDEANVSRLVNLFWDKVRDAYFDITQGIPVKLKAREEFNEYYDYKRK